MPLLVLAQRMSAPSPHQNSSNPPPADTPRLPALTPPAEPSVAHVADGSVHGKQDSGDQAAKHTRRASLRKSSSSAQKSTAASADPAVGSTQKGSSAEQTHTAAPVQVKVEQAQQLSQQPPSSDATSGDMKQKAPDDTETKHLEGSRQTPLVGSTEMPLESHRAKPHEGSPEPTPAVPQTEVRVTRSRSRRESSDASPAVSIGMLSTGVFL